MEQGAVCQMVPDVTQNESAFLRTHCYMCVEATDDVMHLKPVTKSRSMHSFEIKPNHFHKCSRKDTDNKWWGEGNEQTVFV